VTVSTPPSAATRIDDMGGGYNFAIPAVYSKAANR
jgi:hypothetical protein